MAVNENSRPDPVMTLRTMALDCHALISSLSRVGFSVTPSSFM